MTGPRTFSQVGLSALILPSFEAHGGWGFTRGLLRPFSTVRGNSVSEKARVEVMMGAEIAVMIWVDLLSGLLHKYLPYSWCFVSSELGAS